jgi:ABC-type multidrug transport system fused ATPase/permease subunit
MTAVMIAHRLSTLRNADIIYVLANGQVAEQGSYTELADGNGLFAAMLAKTQ